MSFIGFFYFIVKRFILKKAPVPSSAFKTVPKELMQKCVQLVKKQDKNLYPSYIVPEYLLTALQQERCNEVYLKQLLCDICAHLGIDGSYIKLVVQDTPASDRAGEISTDLAFTTVCLEMKPYYTLDTVAAVLAHEATHLHLYLQGIRLRDAWENEILTDTAAVVFGFGDVLYRGYEVRQGGNLLSYQKVGYISQEDVVYIQELLREKE